MTPPIIYIRNVSICSILTWLCQYVHDRGDTFTWNMSDMRRVHSNSQRIRSHVSLLLLTMAVMWCMSNRLYTCPFGDSRKEKSHTEISLLSERHRNHNNFTLSCCLCFWQTIFILEPDLSRDWNIARNCCLMFSLNMSASSAMWMRNKCEVTKWDSEMERCSKFQTIFLKVISTRVFASNLVSSSFLGWNLLPEPMPSVHFYDPPQFWFWIQCLLECSDMV